MILLGKIKITANSRNIVVETRTWAGELVSRDGDLFKGEFQDAEDGDQIALEVKAVKK